ncbi:hydroxylase [Streptomyces subrutilus]|uniref:Hydroxylase n=1 Tax=Streptomyces subrutilus TaxID=36818 RepID=A0A5P2US34_9ACTN|nr:NmrA family NAD(P)-binding protein [Streptomyces subrutilus]QEU82122.1 hydroxylase [Streptomyces subrutilus]GGZ88969.1 hydroxylase [Streptomyces subrutilus]
MTYVIHGATGAQGAPVVSALAATGRPLVALTRNADAVVKGAARVVSADYSSAEQLTAAYRGAAGVFVHLPLGAEADRVRYARTVLAAIREARPSRVVFSTSGSGGGALDEPADSAVSTLTSGLEAGEVSFAVVQPRLFLENLLLPPVLDAARERGVLRYPLRADYPVSWASHLDVAEVAAALFDRPDITGVIAVGQDPAVTGPDLAAAFGARLGREVAYEAITPTAFGASIAPLFGEGPAAGVAGLYQALGALAGNAIAPERSAQQLLGLSPRTTGRWLADIGL